MKSLKKRFKFFFIILFSLLNLFCLYAEDYEEEDNINLGHIYTFLEKPLAEERLVISKEEIEESRCENLTSLLQRKGIQILSYGAYGLESKPSIRGFTDETVRIVMDGICLNNAQYGTFDFSSINLNQIEKIEIVKGGFTEGISDEGSVAGTIYITTKKQDVKKEIYSDTSFKTFFNPAAVLDTVSQKLNFSSPVKENSFFKTSLAFTAAQNKYLYLSGENKYLFRDNSQVWDTSASFAFTHFYGQGSSFTFTDFLYAGNKFCPGPENNTNIGLQKDYNNRFILNIINPAIFSAFRLENNFAYFTNVRFYDEASSSSSHYLHTLTYSSSLSFFASDFFKQSAGFTFEGNFLSSTDDGKVNQLTFTFKETSKFFFNDIFSLSLPLSVKFQGQNFAFVPKAGLRTSFFFGDFSFLFYTMVQFPNMDDLYWNGQGAVGNPDLKEERGWGVEITFNSKINFLPFSLCFFTNYYENKIQWAYSDGLYSPENLSSAFYAGLDFDLEKSFFDEVFSVKFSGEYLYNRLLDKSNSLTYGKRIMWTPDFTTSLILNLKLEKWSFALDTSYMGKRYKSNLNISFLKPYVLMNFSASYKGLKIFEPYIKIDNMLFADYESVENYPMPLTSLTAGLSLKKNF